MVDAKALIALPAAAAIIPIGPDMAFRMGYTQSISPSVIQYAPISLTTLRLHQRIIFHRLDGIDVIVARNHIIIAGQYSRHLFCPDFRGAFAQPSHPAQFEFEFGTRVRIAIGQIDARNPYFFSIFAADIGFKIAAVLVFRFSVEAALDLFGHLITGQYGDAIETLLAVPDRAIADFLELIGGKADILRLDFLQTGDVRARFFEPLEQAWQARLDAIYVEAGYFHLDGEAGPATAARGRVGIGYLKGAAAKRLDKIDRATAHQIQADFVDDQGNTGFFNRDIIRFNAVGKTKAILESGTATAFDGKPQNRRFTLLFGNSRDALGSIGGEDDILFGGCYCLVHDIKIGRIKRSGKP